MEVTWAEGDAYERFMGRWSRQVAPPFLEWLHPARGLRWADVGCGSGALTAAVLAHTAPASVLGLDPAPAQVTQARRQVVDDRVRFERGDADALRADSVDVVISGLVLNFVPDPVAAVTAMAHATPGGEVAAYVWDYARGMQLLRTFWDVACGLNPAASDLHEGHRFQLPTAGALVEVWEAAGLGAIRSTAITVPTVFADFDDYWLPFLGGQGPAPGYVASLHDTARNELREALRQELTPSGGGPIRLTARAWAVSGRSEETA